MPNLHEIVDEIIAREAAQAMAKVEVPRAPEVRPAADELAEPELDARNPHASRAMTVAQAALAVVGMAVGYLT